MGHRSYMGLLGCLAFASLSLIACETTTNVGGNGGNGGSGGNPGPLPKADKVDLLLVVDNSRSMADKQEILARATADLVQSITNPPCIDANGQIGQTPASPADPCPAGQTRRHVPVNDMHVGVISTSIGGHGSDACPDVDTNSKECSPTPNTTNNDKAHLLSRTDVCGGGQAVPTYQSQGFLAWDRNGSFMPPGSNDAAAFAKDIADMVLGVGQIGCGYESQHESWYRFLADPQPYESISVVNNEAVPSGVDNVLLAQRANFLRPDSMLVILQLSDENDCSISETGQFYLAAQLRNPGGGTPFRMPRARSECATNPNDPCCLSCGQTAPANCPVDPTCKDGNGQLAYLSEAEDNINLRCFDQKRRFGIDFLYPIDRYVDGLTQTMIADRAGNMVPNPIFSDLNPGDDNSTVRDPGLVFMGTITGVPWQLIARDSADLKQGFKSSAEMTNDGTWNSLATAANMKESIDPRSQVAANYNGGDRPIPQKDDLQYACIFDLAVSRDCTDMSLSACDCVDPSASNPLCDPNTKTLQIGAKAYPGLREIELVKSLGDQGVLTSICPAQINDAAQADYAYRPVVRALVERMATRL